MKKVYALFIHFQKAYDSIHRDFILNALKHFKLLQKIINLIRGNIIHTEIKIKIGNVCSKGAGIKTRLGQGDALSPIPFNI